MSHNQETYLPEEIIPSSIEYHMFHISKKSRAIYLTLLIIILLPLASLPFIYVDITITAPGRVHAGIETQTLYSPATGMVMHSQLQSYEKVKAGDTLLIMDTLAKQARYLMLRHLNSENEHAISDLNALLAYYSGSEKENKLKLKLPLYVSEYAHFSRKQQHHHTTLEKASNDHKRTEQLYHLEVVPKVEYEMARHLLEHEKALTEANLLQQLSSWQHDLSLRISEQARLTADIQQLEEEIASCYLIAPVTGTITLSADTQVGSQLFANKPVAELSPEGELFITASVSPADIGYLYHDQEVRIAVDGYNHHLWGLLDASISEISEDIITEAGSNRPHYRIRCRLYADHLTLKNGSVAHLKKGMTVNCRMMKTRKSLFHLLVTRLDRTLNPANHHKD